MTRIKLIFLLAYIVFVSIDARAQTVIFGANDYIEYQVGTLPIVISVPHGGALVPSTIPDRTCNNPTTVTDANTVAVGRALSDSIFSRTGCYPHVIYCHLRRTKLDANRNIDDGACGDVAAELAWTEYHHFIDSAQQLAAAQYADEVLYFDIHGHGHPKARIEYGYLLEKSDLLLPDSILIEESYLNESSIQGLVRNNRQNLDHVTLLRGPEAFGTLLADAGYPGVPSLQDPTPEEDDPYFTGGYSTQVHTTATAGVIANGIQLELNRPGIRDTDENRKNFAGAFSDAVVQFIGLHTTAEVEGCDVVVSTHQPILLQSPNDLVCVPTLLSSAQREVRFPELRTAELYDIEIITFQGRVVQQGEMHLASLVLNEGLMPGSYFVRVRSQDSGTVRIGRVMIF